MNEAVRTTLTDIGRYFRATQTPFAIIGGIAVVARGEPRFTGDIDVVAGIVERQGPAIDWEYVMRTGGDLQEALGQDFLPQLERLRRASTSGPGEGDLPRGR